MQRRLIERRIKHAWYPVATQLESFNFKAISSHNKMLLLDLARGDCIDCRGLQASARPTSLWPCCLP